jgi:hypothetical protein
MSLGVLIKVYKYTWGVELIRAIFFSWFSLFSLFSLMFDCNDEYDEYDHDSRFISI